MAPSTCVRPGGKFIYGIHKPSYSVSNHRIKDTPSLLGVDGDGNAVYNHPNLVTGAVQVEEADQVFEIRNPFPFKGVTYINKVWADASANNPKRFFIEKHEEVSLHDSMGEAEALHFIEKAPAPLLLALATTSSDARDLVAMATRSCTFSLSENGELGLVYREKNGRPRAEISDFLLFEAVANNIHLPNRYKIAMVIRPGAQGDSPITAEWIGERGHAYEYLRCNSYIAGGHYAANMAEDAVRYSMDDFSFEDMTGLRSLYYQRNFIRLAEELGIAIPQSPMGAEELEALRLVIAEKIASGVPCHSRAFLWGWNFGFDYAASGYRLHASHQQVHQQYAMIPHIMENRHDGKDSAVEALSPYACGDLLADIMKSYREEYNRDYFLDYLDAIQNNARMDGRDDLPCSLIVWEDAQVIVYVPKAQTSQWEVQVMVKPIHENDDREMFPGNILECDRATRTSLDRGIFMAQQALAGLGSKMVTSIEYSKPIGESRNQPLIYALLPRLPESPGAFSENQMRFINGHYPEDMARALRDALERRSEFL